MPQLDRLPPSLAALARHALAARGATSDHLLTLADAADEAGEAAPDERQDWRLLSKILREAAPAYAPPPLTALDACRRAVGGRAMPLDDRGRR